VGKITQWLAGVLAGITAAFSPGAGAAPAVLAETQDYLAYPPLPEYLTEETADDLIYYIQRPEDDPRKAAYFDEFFHTDAEIVQMETFSWYGTPGTGDNPLASCTPVLRVINFNKKDWEYDALNVLYTERTTFSQNVCLTSASGNLFFDYIEFTYNEKSGKWVYLKSSYESDAYKAKQLFCAYVVDSNPLGGPVNEWYTGHSLITSKYYDLYYAVYNGSKTGFVKDPLYGFWFGYEGSGTVTPPDPPDPPNPPDDNLNKDLDGDGIPDLNIDTNDDGKADINIDTNNDDIADLNIDTNGDRKPDINIDTNGDNKPDINIDTTGNGKPDINIDTNDDNKPDINIDTNGDKKPDINIDTNNDNRPDLNIDTNGDNKPDINIDTNNDNKPDINIDTDNNNKPDINIDTNGDENPDLNIDTNNDNKPDINIDTNNDNKPDINIDTNNDNKPDINIDTNNDNKPDINIDTNDDKKPDINIDTNDDKKPDLNIDTDGDNIPDRDIDTDGDGKPDHKVSHSDIGDGSEFIPDDSYEPHYEDWHLFDPFDYTDTYKDPFSDDEPYDPLEGWEPPKGLPGIETPDVPPYRHCWEPFVKPVQDMVNGQK